MHIGTVLVAASLLSLSASSGRAQAPAPPTPAQKGLPSG
jgi:hypothetical protein